MRVLGALAVAVALGTIGCGRGDPQTAEGAGYGLGVPRTAFIMGRPPQAKGVSNASFVAIEHVDYRPRAPHAWPSGAGWRMPLTWAQYRGSPSNR
jgi:hypothetical protein